MKETTPIVALPVHSYDDWFTVLPGTQLKPFILPSEDSPSMTQADAPLPCLYEPLHTAMAFPLASAWANISPSSVAMKFCMIHDSSGVKARIWLLSDVGR